MPINQMRTDHLQEANTPDNAPPNIQNFLTGLTIPLVVFREFITNEVLPFSLSLIC